MSKIKLLFLIFGLTLVITPKVFALNYEKIHEEEKEYFDSFGKYKEIKEKNGIRVDQIVKWNGFDKKPQFAYVIVTTNNENVSLESFGDPILGKKYSFTYELEKTNKISSSSLF